MTKSLLWLDDVRDPFDKKVDWLVFSPVGRNVDVHWVTNYMEFVDWIMINGLPDGICFDHDLSDVEIWFESVDNPKYFVSNFGRVKRGEKILKITYGENGGTICYTNPPEKRKNIVVHRFIANTLIENKENKPQINHKDGNRWNNHISNLEWCTNSENVLHSHNNLKREYTSYGENHNNSVSVTQYDKLGNIINVFGSVNEAGRQLGIQFTNIAKCARGERKTAGGYIWKYQNMKPTIKSIITHIPKKEKKYQDRFYVPDFKEKTGYDCAKWLIDYCDVNNLELPKYNIQSANPIGRQNIDMLLKNYLKFKQENT